MVSINTAFSTPLLDRYSPKDPATELDSPLAFDWIITNAIKISAIIICKISITLAHNPADKAVKHGGKT